jgi:hypothetical protein
MKKMSARLRARDGAVSLLGFFAVLGSLVLVDERVGRHVKALLEHGPGRDFDAVGSRLSMLGDALLTAARDQSIDHAPMLAFTAVAIVLVFFMTRT